MVLQIMEQLIRLHQGIDGCADSKDMADVYADLQVSLVMGRLVFNNNGHMCSNCTIVSTM